MADLRRVELHRTRNGWWQVLGDGRIYAAYRGGDNARMRAEERASRLRIHAAILDDHLPLRGPCGLCGSGEDQTHRVLDSIADWAALEVREGNEDVGWIAEEFGIPTEYAKDVCEAAMAWQAYRPRPKQEL